jgi:hypothetical protein
LYCIIGGRTEAFPTLKYVMTFPLESCSIVVRDNIPATHGPGRKPVRGPSLRRERGGAGERCGSRCIQHRPNQGPTSRIPTSRTATGPPRWDRPPAVAEYGGGKGGKGGYRVAARPVLEAREEWRAVHASSGWVLCLLAVGRRGDGGRGASEQHFGMILGS